MLISGARGYVGLWTQTPNGPLIKTELALAEIELALAQEYFYICDQKDGQDISALDFLLLLKNTYL